MTKRKAKAPSFQFYPSDFFGDPKVRTMSADAKAFYALLLLNIWEYDTQFSIPDDPNLISKLLEIAPTRWMSLREEIVKFSSALRVTPDARLLSPRLRVEKAKADNYRKSQAEKGKWKRQPWFNHGSTAVQPVFNPPTPTPTPTLLSSSKTQKREVKKDPLNAPQGVASVSDSLRADFELFWKAYPKRSGNKALVFDRYKTARKSATAEEILRGAQNYAAECRADNDGRGRDARFIKWPQGWLSEKRWLLHQKLSEEAEADAQARRMSELARTEG